MTLSTVGDIAHSEATYGRHWQSFVHKTSAPIPGAAGQWGDLSMGAGTPKYNAYVGSQLEATQLVNAGNNSIYLGPTPASGQRRVLSRLGVQSTQGTQNVPLSLLLCDYLMFYPLIDGDNTDEQQMDNTATLPRYATGDGVRAFLVTTSPMTTNGTAVISYTSSDGVAGRSVTVGVAASSNLGAIAHRTSSTVQASTSSPFLNLAGNDGGLRSVDAVTLPTPTGGFMALVLCRPLASILVREASTWTEKVSFLTRGGVCPTVYDGAFLNFIFQTSGTGNPATFRASVDFTWG